MKRINDIHIHVGQFFDQYFSPELIWKTLNKLDIEKACIMSTTIGDGRYTLVVKELQKLKQLGGVRIYPFLWLMPQMEMDGGLDIMLNSRIIWQCIKIHPWQIKGAGQPKSHELTWALSVAKKLKLPIMIHTGYDDICTAGVWKDTVKNNPEQRFIFAHSRKIEDTIDILATCPNAFCDTAFASPDWIKQIIDHGLIDRVAWGSDLPINLRYYKNLDSITWYEGIVSAMKKAIGEENFETISGKNFDKILLGI